MKTVAVIQARMSSTRLPGKVLKDLGGKPALQWCVEAAKRAPGVDEVVIATSTLSSDDPVATFGAGLAGVTVFRGDLTDVLSRFLGAATETKADILVRLTGDCPLLDPAVIGEVIQLRRMKGAEYATNTDPPTYPDGLDTEVFTRNLLEITHREATRPSDRDTVTRFMVRNRHRFPAANLVCSLPALHQERWVLDSPEDYEFLQKLVEFLPKDRPSSYLEILKVLDEHPSLRDINAKYTRNERFYDGMLADMGGKRSYSLSEACLHQAESLIPLGAQTFSKSKLQFPEGVAPLFVTHGDGGYCYDVDGNDYIDIVGSLLPNILGYRDPEVDAAIRDQLNRGASHSLATTLEYDLAERLSHHIPSAEMVRFGKNGSDVTTAAVRLARHITGRSKVHVCGYHGWHDWSMAVTDRNNGIPIPVQSLSARYAWGERFEDNEVAAIIIEPEFWGKKELIDFQKLCADNGSLLIFDEIISGFRMGMGGLQKAHGVTPDLSTFGKAMGNGMPISALVGKAEFMKRMPEISYSGTFFGETLSIAASIATIDKLARCSVPDYLNKIGLSIRGAVCTLLEKHKLGESISLYGHPALNRIKFKDKAIQSLFIQEMAKQGILIIGSHNTCFAHKKPELDKIIDAWDKTLGAIASGAKLEGGVIKGKSVR